MTMFSMKPKFDLAAFLAEPAKPSNPRRRNTMMKTARAPVPDEDETEVEAGSRTPSA